MAETRVEGDAHFKTEKPEAAVIKVDDSKNSKTDKEEATFDAKRGDVAVNDGSMDDVEFRDGSSGLRRDRPFSASVVSRRSTKSTQSRASLNPHLITSDYAAGNLFAHRTGIIDDAVNACKQAILNDVDGEVKDFWMLTEIDHWDLEKEKLIILTANSLIIVKYDFIALAVGKFRRILLRQINRMEVGDLTYPPSSVMPPRQHGGLRIYWPQTTPTFLQKWNPWTQDLGYVTLTHHLLIYNEKEKETTTFNVSDLYESLVEAVEETRKRSGLTNPLIVNEGPIMIESYASLSSMVYNQSHLGFNMERGGISF